MRREHTRHKSLTRRAVLLGGAQFLLAAGLGGRLYQLQILGRDRYAVLSDKNRVSLRLIPPPRGCIFDRYGAPIALNVSNYQAVLVPEQSGDIDHTLNLFGRIVPLRDQDRTRILRDIERKRVFVPVLLKENLAWGSVARIEVNAQDLPGISIDVGRSRHYPDGVIHCHVSGYVAAVSPKDYGRDPLHELPGFRVGKSGVEKRYDADLRGKAGTLQVEVNALGRVIRELDRDESQAGQDMSLTVDNSIQAFAHRRVDGLNASVVVMDVTSGEVLGLVSTPGFNPNDFNKGLDPAAWSRLSNDPNAPLTNKVIMGQYPPGSTFKMMVALAALEENLITPQHTFMCPGWFEFGDRKFHCWRRKGHGQVNLNHALSESCDVYFYKLARKLGIKRIAAMAARFGFGQPLGIDLPGERPGLLPSPQWKQETIGRPWQKGETLIAAIGQGYILATPLQLAVMTARLVNGGRAVTPFIAFGHDGHPANAALFPPAPVPSLGVSGRALALVRKGMDEAVNAPFGTAFSARITGKNNKMGGKTGTSQVRRISRWERENRVLKNEERLWHQRDHSLFVGYAPVHQPRYACCVVVEHGGSGSKVAAPIARDVLTHVQERAATAPPVRFPQAGRHVPDTGA